MEVGSLKKLIGLEIPVQPPEGCLHEEHSERLHTKTTANNSGTQNNIQSTELFLFDTCTRLCSYPYKDFELTFFHCSQPNQNLIPHLNHDQVMTNSHLELITIHISSLILISTSEITFCVIVTGLWSPRGTLVLNRSGFIPQKPGYTDTHTFFLPHVDH